MQLKKRNKGRLWQSLGLVTTNLFVATHGHAAADSLVHETGSEPGTATIDSAVLFYHESGGRVRAIEPITTLKVFRENGDVFRFRATYDSLTGATPNGAAPSDQPQVFTTPAAPPNERVSVTSASGRRTIITLPGTGTRVAQYTVPAHQLPMDAGFTDSRTAFDLSYTRNWASDTAATLGIGYSTETDFKSYSINSELSQSLFEKSTVLTLGLDFEHDDSNPVFGTPTPMTEMNGLEKGAGDTRNVTNLIAGVTEAVNRHWLLQMNYDIGWNKGYMNDPYKIVSVVDGETGLPSQYLYESRPRSRVRQSLYVGNKVAFGPTVLDVSFRYYRDDWGIESMSGEAAERIPLSRRLYVEPEFHYYRQSAADLFRYYLIAGQPLPRFASADGRLAKLDARTLGLKVGYMLSRHAELYALAEDYEQSGASILPDAPGGLADEKFFSGVHATSVAIGFSYTFDFSNL